MDKKWADKAALLLLKAGVSIQKRYGSKLRVASGKNLDLANDPQELPSPPMYVLTVRWSDDGQIVVDTRGFTIMEAWSILQRSADEVSALIEDPIVILDGEEPGAFVPEFDDDDEDDDEDE